MSLPEDWLEEAHARLEDALFLFERERYARAVSAAYYACHAAGRGLLLTKDVQVHRHSGLRNRLGYHFVRSGTLSARVTRLLAELEQARLDADYDLRAFSKEETEALLDEARRCLREIEGLV